MAVGVILGAAIAWGIAWAGWMDHRREYVTISKWWLDGPPERWGGLRQVLREELSMDDSTRIGRSTDGR